MMLASRDLVSCWTVGEAWKRPYLGRTLFSLERCGLHAQASDYWTQKTLRPPSYSDLVRDALERTGPGRYALIVPSGILPTPAFVPALDRYLGEIRADDGITVEFSAIPETPRVAILAQGTTTAQSTGVFYNMDPIRQHLTKRFPRALEKTTPIRLRGGVIPRYRIEQGRHTFQDLAKDPERIAMERPLDEATSQTLCEAPREWVFLCNTEAISGSIPEAQGCDVMAVVSSGIKPWFLANELRHSLEHLIVFDNRISQLRFAFEAFEAIGGAPSWSSICESDGSGSTMAGEASRAEHDALYQRIRAVRSEWHFEATFLHCDLLAQTFRLLEFIKSRRPRRLILWYSNIFHPFFGQRFSEDHYQVEMSFIRLMREEFPGVLLYNSHREPAGEAPLN